MRFSIFSYDSVCIFRRICAHCSFISFSPVSPSKTRLEHLEPAQHEWNVSPAWFKKVRIKPRGCYLPPFFHIVTDTRYNSMATTVSAFLRTVRVREFRVAAVFIRPGGKRRAKTTRISYSNFLWLKIRCERRTASGNVRRARAHETRLHPRPREFPPSFRSSRELFF